MKNIGWTEKWTKNKIIFFGILSVISIIMIYYGKVGHENDVKSILEDCEYTVGTVKVFFFAISPPEPYVEYKYKVDNTEIEGKRYHKFPPREGVEKGEKYIVAYSNKNLKKSLLLFDYPVKEEGDFENYLKKFKYNPPR